MRILAVSDFHGALGWLPEALDRLRPDLLLSPGDWGDPGEVTEASFAPLLERAPILTVWGNHDDRDLLARLRNRNGAPVLLSPGEEREIEGMVVAGMSGIWAKTRLGSRLDAEWERARRRSPDLTLEAWLAGRPLPPYVTDDEVRAWAARLAGRGVDVLITHECPVGLADRTPAGFPGGKRVFREVFETVRPRLHLCGHLHRFQRADLPDGRGVLNCGDGGKGEGWVIEWERGSWEARPLVMQGGG